MNEAPGARGRDPASPPRPRDAPLSEPAPRPPPPPPEAAGYSHQLLLLLLLLLRR